MKRRLSLLPLALWLVLVAPAMADDLSANLGGPGQGFASLVTGNGEIGYGIVVGGIGTPTSAVILQGNSVFVDLNASFTDGFTAGTVQTAADLAALNANPNAFTLRVQGPGGNASGQIRFAAEGGGGDPDPDPEPDPDPDPDPDPGPDPGRCEVVESQGTAPCVADATTLCLTGDRFEVQVGFSTDQEPDGTGMAQPLTADTGYFWFFDQTNVEVVVKVLDACSFADRFWIFAGGLTNVEVEMTVRDTETGETRLCSNPPITAFQPIQDTNAFATCP